MIELSNTILQIQTWLTSLSHTAYWYTVQSTSMTDIMRVASHLEAALIKVAILLGTSWR